MNEQIDEIAFFHKFPVILKDKLKSGEIAFPEGTQFQYFPIKAYRGIKREADDYSKVGKEDFKSYAELGRKKVRGQRIVENTPEYYGVSLFRKKEIVENLMKFPNPHKKMAMGYVFEEGGPQLTNEETEHVCWWLYLDADLDGFTIMTGGNNDE